MSQLKRATPLFVVALIGAGIVFGVLLRPLSTRLDATSPQVTWGPATMLFVVALLVGGIAWNTPDHVAVGRAVLDAAGDAGNRWIFPELVEQGLEPWNGVRWVAVAGSASPTHAADASAGMERAVHSLLEHHSYIEALTDEDPETYVRGFLTANATATGERFGGRPAVAFEVFSR